ncbi:MAG: iron/zinc/nickel/cobalt/cadmium efflux protein [Acidobacteria bacterium]|jgi:ferrous-iron efflux pump FieF|nr:iron/zinc/nickel/cobalt/cadmium efflux protein [Acidobacteriota bacterium]
MSDQRRKVVAATVATGTATVLAAAKLVVAVITGSLAVLASAVDSLMDVACSGLNAWFLRLAGKGPDEEHAFGHGKAEALSGVIQAVIIVMGGVWLIVRGVARLIRPEPLSTPETGIAVSLVAFTVSLFLVAYLRREARATRSIALQADAFHYVTDIATNVVAGVALAGYRWLGWWWLDPVASLAIAFYVIASAVEILRAAADELLDRGLPREVEDDLARLISGLAPEVQGYRSFRSRRAGGTDFVEFDLLVDRATSFERSHELAEAAARAIRERRGDGAQVMVHADPV